MIGVLTQPIQEDLDVLNATFVRRDLTTFTRLDELGLEAVGQHVKRERAMLACRVVEPDQWWRRCGCEGTARDTVTGQLAHEPFGWRPTVLVVRLRRYRCGACGHLWRQDMSKAGQPRSKLSRRALRWALEGLVVAHLTVARITEGLAVSWNTANDAVLVQGQRVLVNDPSRFDGVQVIGVDEHVWRHTRKGDKYVTVIIDLTAVRHDTGPARLSDMAEGRSKQAFKTWLASRPRHWRAGIEVLAMDGITGFKTATTEELPDATPVLDPLHVVALAGHALDQCRRRIQQALHGHRGRATDPLDQARPTLHTGMDLLTARHKTRLEALFTDDEHVQVEATWATYHKMTAAYREPNRAKGRQLTDNLIQAIANDVPGPLAEVVVLGRTPKKREAHVLAYLDQPGTSNGPSEALNGRLEHLRGSAPALRNLTHYITRSLHETSGLRPRLHRGS